MASWASWIGHFKPKKVVRLWQTKRGVSLTQSDPGVSVSSRESYLRDVKEEVSGVGDCLSHSHQKSPIRNQCVTLGYLGGVLAWEQGIPVSA